MPIKIDFVSNVTRFLRGTEDTEKALDDVADALDDVVRDGDKAERQLERNFREISASAKDTGRKVGDDVKDGFKRAEQGAEEFKDEANSTAREAAASFDGSAESIGDVFQEIAANAFAGFGPAGAVAGLAAATGIGLAVAGFEQSAEAQAAAEERIAGWADKYLEAGQRIIGAAQVVAEVQSIATDPERYKEAGENAKNWGVDTSTAMRAMAGDATALTVVQQTVADRQKRWAEIVEETSTGSANSWDKSNMTGKQQEYGQAVLSGVDALERLTGEMKAGSDRAHQVSEALLDLVENSSSAAVEIDELGNKLVTLPDGTEIIIDAKTGEASQAVSRFKGDVDGVIDQLNGRQVRLSVEADTSAAERKIKAVTDAVGRTVYMNVNARGAMKWE